MLYTSYTLRRVLGVAWSWDADFRGQASRRGYCLIKGSARWAARSWLRQRREAVEPPIGDERISIMASKPTPERTFHFSPPIVARTWNFGLRARTSLPDSDPHLIAQAPIKSLEEAH
jgi:hypothetical protein